MLQDSLYRFAGNASVLMVFGWLLSKMNASSTVEANAPSESLAETEERNASDTSNVALIRGVPSQYSLYYLFSKESANKNTSPSNKGEGLPWTAYSMLLKK